MCLALSQSFTLSLGEFVITEVRDSLRFVLFCQHTLVMVLPQFMQKWCLIQNWSCL